MIAEIAQELVGLITTVPDLENSTGLALGGHGVDLGLVQIPLPAAWIIYSSDMVDEAPFGSTSRVSPGMVPAVEVVTMSFMVNLYVAYVDQADLLNVQYPLLESVIKAVRGKQTVAGGHRWRYMGQKVAFVAPERLIYQQVYRTTVGM